MFNFFRKRKTPEKYDDIDWHEAEDSPERRAIHVALMFIWLASRGHIIKDTYSPALTKDIKSRNKKPSEILDRYADGMLVSSMMSPDAIEFLNEFYEEEFFNIVEDGVVQFDRTNADAPYNIEDSWKNVDKACVWIDDQYKNWLSSKKS